MKKKLEKIWVKNLIASKFKISKKVTISRGCIEAYNLNKYIEDNYARLYKVMGDVTFCKKEGK